ncbi:DegT/DnrJ/EryC1/StrS family aminotransferase [Tunturiibacter gelidoferens]|jgi:perosamine synthetase|uniref:GDP-perosamine synthase n=1 Tax=Tunturiibacter gelidiferens TaxID=3069689 RepID=A0A9X0U6M6_9BACT|nr:DegT/DnrJ/EryC1/StrS family aminotransferase [Edaphobacter lichenicola]MBB5329977.1 dTDP-4-amino-4,6-dideoxygalactose transaminase [Edaphobacter lichenicola]
MSVLSIPVSAMIPVARPYIGSEEEKAVIDVLRSGWVTQGPRVAEFEEKFSSYIGCDYSVAVSSCTTALHLAFMAIGVGPGDEVICPSLSFIATANSITYTGATPIFADIDLSTYNIDPARLEEVISPRTKAILVVHQIGLPAEMNEILAVANKHGLVVIEDAACAIGSEYDGKLIGKPLGTMACFSFHPRKILTTGEGGMITTSNAKLAERLRRLRQHAMSLSDVVRHNATQVSSETYDEVGYNFRMTDMQAAIGITQLGRLASFLERRRYFAARYTKALQNLPWVQTPVVPTNCRPNYQSYMVRLTGDSATKRDAIMQNLLEKKISTRRAIMATHREPPYRSAHWESRLLQTNLACDTALILPLFHQMTESEQDYIIEALRTC